MYDAITSVDFSHSFFFFFSSRRRHTRFDCDWSSDVCSSDLQQRAIVAPGLTADVDACPPVRIDQRPVAAAAEYVAIHRRAADAALADLVEEPGAVLRWADRNRGLQEHRVVEQMLGGEPGLERGLGGHRRGCLLCRYGLGWRCVADG